MIFATGGTALGEISIKSSPRFIDSSIASRNERTPKFSPSSVTTRSCGARIWLFMRILGINFLKMKSRTKVSCIILRQSIKILALNEVLSYGMKSALERGFVPLEIVRP